MEHRHPQVGSHQPLRARKVQNKPRAPVALRAPQEEEEDPRVKCKDCGAFGHKASSTRCPMKRWDGALAPQPLGSQKMKENQRLCNPQDTRRPGLTARPAGEKEQRPSQEDLQRQALLKRFPRRPLGRLQPTRKDQIESCAYVRHPHQPMPVQTTRRRCVGDPRLTSRSPVRKPDETSTVSPIHTAESSTFSPQVLSKGQGVHVSDSHDPAGTGFVQGPGSKPHSPGRALIPPAQAKDPGVKSPRMGQAAAQRSGQVFKVSHKAPSKRAAQSPVQSCQNPQKKPRPGHRSPQQNGTLRADPGCVQPVLPPASAPALRPALAPQAPRKTPAHGQSGDLPPPHEGPLLSTVHTGLVSQHSLVPQRPCKPLRMVFRRLKNGQWSSRLLITPSVLPAEEPAPTAQSPPCRGKSDGPCTCALSSVLYRDLQVSSSSEDSEDLQVCSSCEDSDGQRDAPYYKTCPLHQMTSSHCGTRDGN